jgi:hypothetical protein
MLLVERDGGCRIDIMAESGDRWSSATEEARAGREACRIQTMFVRLALGVGVPGAMQATGAKGPAGRKTLARLVVVVVVAVRGERQRQRMGTR